MVDSMPNEQTDERGKSERAQNLRPPSLPACGFQRALNSSISIIFLLYFFAVTVYIIMIQILGDIFPYKLPKKFLSCRNRNLLIDHRLSQRLAIAKPLNDRVEMIAQLFFMLFHKLNRCQHLAMSRSLQEPYIRRMPVQDIQLMNF